MHVLQICNKKPLIYVFHTIYLSNPRFGRLLFFILHIMHVQQNVGLSETMF